MSVREVDPIFGWRQMNMYTYGFLVKLMGMCNGLLVTAHSPPARCYPMGVSMFLPTSKTLDVEGTVHDAEECPSVRVYKNNYPCGYYATYRPDFEYPLPSHGSWELVWIYVQAIGLTYLHDDGFRTSRYRVVALVGPDIPQLNFLGRRFGVPVFHVDTPDRMIQEYCVPVNDVRAIQQYLASQRDCDTDVRSTGMPDTGVK